MNQTLKIICASLAGIGLVMMPFGGEVGSLGVGLLAIFGFAYGLLHVKRVF